jgi:hypothetical protein
MMPTDVEKFSSHVYCTPPTTKVYGTFFVAEYLVTGMESLDTLKPWLWFQLRTAFLNTASSNRMGRHSISIET